VAALGRVEADSLVLSALISDLEGRRVLREERSGPVAEAAGLGTQMAESLLARGGGEILAELYGHPVKL
jgi:hydroxymethylbilane synthase